jgi:hypothetical protein
MRNKTHQKLIDWVEGQWRNVEGMAVLQKKSLVTALNFEFDSSIGIQFDFKQEYILLQMLFKSSLNFVSN